MLKKQGTTFWIASLLIILISILALSMPSKFVGIINLIKNKSSEKLSLFFLITPLIFLIILLYIAFSKWGRRRLGGEKIKPEYRTFTWIAMLFTAGVGVGTLTFGVAEPIFHITGSPMNKIVDKLKDVDLTTLNETQKQSLNDLTNSFSKAMELSVWDWGLPAMAIYSISGLVVGWFAFNKKYKQSFLPGSVIENGFNSKYSKYLGNLTNIIAAIAAVFTVAASLAIGGNNMVESVRLAYFSKHSWDDQWLVKGLSLGFLALIGLVYILGALTPLKKGMAKMGNITMYAGIGLMFFVFVIGPTIYFSKQMVESMKFLVTGLQNHFDTKLFDISKSDTSWINWLNNWPNTYILWWISWTPFMSVFLAKISKGRTLKEYCLATIFIPAIFMAIWFSIFGGLGFISKLNGDSDIFDQVAKNGSVDGAFFQLLSKFPLLPILGGLTLFLFVFFIATTGTSASVSIATIVSKDGQEKPKKYNILLWALAMLAIAIALILASGWENGKLTGFDGIKNTAVTLGIIYIFILYIQIMAMFKSMKNEKKEIEEREIKYGTIEAIPNKKTKFKQLRKKIILYKVVWLTFLILFTVLCLRGIFSNTKGWEINHMYKNDVSFIEQIIGGFLLIWVILQILNISYFLNNQFMPKTIKIMRFYNYICLDIFSMFLFNNLLTNQIEIDQFNDELKISWMSPIELEEYLKSLKKHN